MLETKTRHTLELEKIDLELADLKKKNDYIEKILNDPELE
jgi:hypothetical protein